MGALRWEGRKLLCHRYGWLILTISLLLQLLLLVATDQPTHRGADQFRTDYRSYLSQVEGVCTPERGAWLEAEAQAITQAELEVDQLYQDYYAGGLTAQELETQLEPLEEKTNRSEGFDALYSQYAYIAQDPERRYFLDVNGWAGLLGEDGVDVVLILTLILLVTPMLCGEYVCSMDTLALTTRGGHRSLFDSKLWLALLVAVGLSVAGLALRLGFYALRYGLSHWDYPLQSVQLFGSSDKALSLGQAFALLSASRVLGAVYLAALILGLSALTRQYALTVFLSAALVVLPWAGLDMQGYYRCPLPLPFLMGTGFLLGDETGQDPMTGETVYNFRALSWGQIGVLVGVSVAVGLVCIALVYARSCSAYTRPRRRRAAVVGLLGVLCLLGGCAAPTAQEQGEICYNSHSADVYYYGDYRIQAGLADTAIQVEHQTTGDTFSLNHSALPGLDTGMLLSYQYGVGDQLYYLWEVVDDAGATVTLFCVDLNTFHERVVYECAQAYQVFGVKVNLGSVDAVESGGRFFVHDGGLYLLGNQIQRIDLTTGAVSTLNVNGQQNVAFDGTYLYYTNQRELLCRYNLDTGEDEVWSDYAVYDFCLAGERIYYVNLREEHQLWSIDKQGGDPRPEEGSNGLMAVEWDGRTLTVLDGTGETREIEM